MSVKHSHSGRRRRRSPILATRGGKSVSLISQGDVKNKRVLVEISSSEKTKGEPTVRRGSVTCPVCGYTTPASSARKQFLERAGGTHDAKLLCVITTSKGVIGKTYRKPNEADQKAFQKALSTWKNLKKDRNLYEFEFGGKKYILCGYLSLIIRK